MSFDIQATNTFDTPLRLDLISDGFDRAWIAGEDPRLERYLECVPAIAQALLLRELLRIECKYRKQRKTLQSREGYELRFPEHVEIVREVFRQHVENVETSIIEQSTTQIHSPDGRNTSSVVQTSDCQLDDYEVLQELGRGGMGVVYKARQKSLNRIVAIKLIRAGAIPDEDQLKRFRIEAEAAAKFDHPGIVPIHEFGQANGQHFIAMPFVDGIDLNRRAKESPLEPKSAASIMRLASEAIQYAHDHGIVHRDLKPHNILLVGDTPRITDFGLAKNLKEDSGLTVTGQVIGTPAYMSPEQAKGAAVGPASDIYSLGATLYCLLTGRPPFQAATHLETIRQVVEEEVASPRTLNRGISKNLETICLKCLRKDAGSRYLTAGELGEDLQRLLEGKPITARRMSIFESAWLWCKRRPTVAGSFAAIVVTLLVVSAVIFFQREDNLRRINDARIENDRQRSIALVDSVLMAPPVAVPYAIDALAALQDESLPLLATSASDQRLNESQRLHATLALAQFGDVRTDSLVTAIETAAAEECTNLVTALRVAPDATSLIKQQAKTAQSAANWRHRARLAIIAAYLGDPSIANEMCQPHSDPIERTVFIDSFAAWHGRESELLETLADAPATLQAGLLQGLSRIPPNKLGQGTLEAFLPLLTQLRRESADAVAHSAADLTLRTWGLPALSLAESSPEQGRNWHVNSMNQTMVRIPTGSFTRGADQGQTVTLTRPYFVASKETSVAEFLQFMEDTNTPESDRPKDWTPLTERANPDPTHPVHNVSWSDSVLYCNWLSRREGLTPCYHLEGLNWEWDQTANGYRLPTNAEWELACRAGTVTTFSWGDDASFSHSYAVYMKSSTETRGTHLPNGHGLFDMHGNASEWCYDHWTHRQESEATSTDPIGPPTGSSRILRSGSFRHGELSMSSTYQGYGTESLRNIGTGFRVAKHLD